MYDPNLTYDENYQNGPNENLVRGKKFPKIQYLEKPRFEFLGVPLHIPFGVPAGPLLNSNYVKVALNAGFCLPVYKTVRSCFWESNKWPNVLSLSSEKDSLFADQLETVVGLTFDPKNGEIGKNFSISNSFGVPSKEPRVWSDNFKTCFSGDMLGKTVALSFQASRTAGNSFYEDASKIAELAVDAVGNAKFCLLEINLSCPNEAHKPLYQDLDSTIETLKRVSFVISKHPEIKLIAKIGVLGDKETKSFLNLASPYIHAVSCINTVSSHIVKVDGSAALGSGSFDGGVCGNLILEQGLQMVSRVAQIRDYLGIKTKDLGIIGVGGVSTSEHFQRYLNAGADVVQAATGMMWNLDLASEIAQSLMVPYVEN